MGERGTRGRGIPISPAVWCQHLRRVGRGAEPGAVEGQGTRADDDLVVLFRVPAEEDQVLAVEEAAVRDLWSRALLTPHANPGSLYRCGKCTF